MYFLLSYNLIDRDDLSTNQKMCAIYIARHFDENKGAVPIDETLMASKLKIGISELKMNLDILVRKKIIDEENLTAQEEGIRELKISNLDANIDANIEDFNFLNTQTENKDPAKPEKSKIKSAKISENNQLLFSEDEKELDEEEYKKFIDKLGSVEERLKERTANLKLNIRSSSNSRNAEKSALKYNRRKTDTIRDEKPEETEEILQLLAQSNENIAKQSRRRIPGRKKKEQQNLAFLKASSVYNQSKTVRKTDDDDSNDIEV